MSRQGSCCDLVRDYCRKHPHWWVSAFHAAQWLAINWRIAELPRQFSVATYRKALNRSGITFTRQPLKLKPPPKPKLKFKPELVAPPVGYNAIYCACPHSGPEVMSYAEDNILQFWRGEKRGQHIASVFIRQGVQLMLGATYSCNICGKDVSGWLLWRSIKFFKAREGV